MELLQLRYFFESAKNENFAKTAERHCVPTSSVSASVKRLEKELDCKLFDRTSNRIVLNKNGQRLQQALCTIFSELDSAVADLSSAKNDTREIKLLVRAMRSNITDYIIEFNEKQPQISFKTVFNFNESNYESYDIIIDEKSDRYSEYNSFELFNIRLRLKAAANSPLVGKKLFLKQLCHKPFVSLDENSNMHKILINACNKAGFTPNTVAYSNDIRCYDKLIEAGIGIGISRDASTGSTVCLDVADFNEVYSVYCYFKPDSAYGNVNQFLNFLKTKAY